MLLSSAMAAADVVSCCPDGIDDGGKSTGDVTFDRCARARARITAR